MEERRRAEDKNWEEIKKFIEESRTYRATDEVTQKFQVENIEALKNQVTKQNGRVLELEKWKQEVTIKIKTKYDNNKDLQSLVTVIATVIMAVSALVMYFKK